MAAQHALHVALTQPLNRHVGDQAAKGRGAIAREVVRATLRLPIERDEAEMRRIGAFGKTAIV